MMRGRFLLIAVAVSLLAGGCLQARKASIPLFAAKELALHDAIPAKADFDRPFETPLLAMVSDARGKRLSQLSSCRDYLAVRGHIVGSDTDADYRVLRFQTVPCEAIALLKSATAAAHTAMPSDFKRVTDANSYPASLWPAVSDDERQNPARQTGTLQTASGKTTLSLDKSGALELESGGYGIHLTLLARGDFDHDGWEDAAFRWEAYALQGSYTDARLAVLTRKGNERTFRELNVNRLLSAQSSTDKNIDGVCGYLLLNQSYD
jgi:hypothetical protein